MKQNNRHKAITFIAILVAVLNFYSCGTNRYFQVYEIHSNDSSNTNTNNELSFNDDNLRVTYNLWSEDGLVRFTVHNKTNKEIFLNMEQSFFILNGFAQDYYQASSFSETRTEQIGLGFNLNSEYSSELFYVPSTPIKRGKIKVARSQQVSTYEKNVIIIPPLSSKVLGKFSLTPNRVITCNTNMDYPSKNAQIENYTQSTSPIKFRNRINYSFSKDGTGGKSLDNSFYLSGITNYSKKAAIKRIKSTNTDCRTVKREYFNIGSSNKFYKSYRKPKPLESR